MDNNSVKANIKKFRKTHQLTQSEMADKLGISRTAYRNIENGETRLISDSITKIADILDICSEELVLGYMPDREDATGTGAGKPDRDMLAALERRHAEEEEKLSGEISRLRNENADLRRHLETQEELIRTKDEIIMMLKRLDSKTEKQ